MLLSIARLAKKHGIEPIKKYGQNFIFDETLCDKIVEHSGVNNASNILEIGPGPAGLTRSLLKINPHSLCVIETDARCLPLLEEIKQSYSVLDIRYADALKILLPQVNEEKIDIVANLPYNIGNQLLINWLYQLENVQSMTLMLQREVVDRIVSNHGNKIYGRLSVLCQILCDVTKCFDVSPQAFYPKPKIWSSVLHLKPKLILPSVDIRTKLEQITQHAFSGRRKMIKSSMKQIIPNIQDVLKHLSIDDQLRAENLSPQDYLKIAQNITANV
ncbi:MAG: 16S rRNA (adenine(1518)-N(6)/adenine(1519)-N(6))-dimethyltransferase RsmA [Rickettsiaceae bacterium]